MIHVSNYMYQHMLKKYHLIEMSTTIIKKDQHEMKTIGLINLKRWYNYEANDIVATRLIIMRNSKFLISSKKNTAREILYVHVIMKSLSFTVKNASAKVINVRINKCLRKYLYLKLQASNISCNFNIYISFANISSLLSVRTVPYCIKLYSMSNS